MSPGLDRTRVDQRLERLEALCGMLEATATLSRKAFLEDPDKVDATERRLQIAVQAAIDVAAHLAAANAWATAEGYAGTFRVLAREGVLEPEVAERLAMAAGLRNLLVHDYLAVDPARLHATLDDDVADLRAFIRTVVGWMVTSG